MSMNAEQYRALVQRLEAINEAPLDETNWEVVDKEDDGFDASAEPDVGKHEWEVVDEAGSPDGIPEIEARSLAMAHQIAAKKGLKVFRWCSTYSTNLKKKQPQAGKPAQRTPIQPAVGVGGIKDKTNGWNNNQVDTLNLAAAGGMGA